MRITKKEANKGKRNCIQNPKPSITASNRNINGENDNCAQVKQHLRKKKTHQLNGKKSPTPAWKIKKQEEEEGKNEGSKVKLVT